MMVSNTVLVAKLSQLLAVLTANLDPTSGLSASACLDLGGNLEKMLQGDSEAQQKLRTGRRGRQASLTRIGSLESGRVSDLAMFQDGQALLQSCQLRLQSSTTGLRTFEVAVILADLANALRLLSRPAVHLPPELISFVLSYLLPETWPSPYLDLIQPGLSPYNPARVELFDLCACALVDTTWSALAQPTINQYIQEEQEEIERQFAPIRAMGTVSEGGRVLSIRGVPTAGLDGRAISRFVGDVSALQVVRVEGSHDAYLRIDGLVLATCKLI
jgi:hypothetical protein